MIRSGFRIPARHLALAAGLAALACGVPARADLILSVQSVVVEPGSTGNAFDVLLTNTGADVVDLNGFSFGLTLDPVFEATEITVATANPYIFEGHSTFGPGIGTAFGAEPQASDAYDDLPTSFSLIAGATAGLGHVVFDASPSASGVYAVTFFPSATSLSRNNSDVPIDAMMSGTIAVRPVPEPSGLVLAGLGLVISLAARARSIRRPDLG